MDTKVRIFFHIRTLVSLWYHSQLHPLGDNWGVAADHIGASYNSLA